MPSLQILDSLPEVEGYQSAIDAAAAIVDYTYKTATALAESLPDEPERLSRILGGLSGFWESPTLSQAGLQGKPSSLAQMLILGSLGSLAGYGVGKVVDRFMPTDAFKSSRVGAAVGAILGAAPGAAGAVFNRFGDRPALSTSFYQTKLSSFGYSPDPIEVNSAQQMLWQSPSIPVDLKAYTSGLLNAAATMPGRAAPNPGIITPMDIGRVAIGLGAGVASANMVGNVMGMLFGTGEETKKLLQNTGAVLGVLKAVVPAAYGREPFSI